MKGGFMFQRRIPISFILCLLFFLLFSFIQTEDIKASDQKIRIYCENTNNIKNVQLYQYQGHGNKSKISHYFLVGDFYKQDGSWKIITDQQQVKNYAIAINHGETFEFFKMKWQDIGDVKIKTPEIYLSSAKYLSDDGKQKVRIDLRTISQSGDSISSQFQIQAANDIRNSDGKIIYHSKEHVLNFSGNHISEQYLLPGKYRLVQRKCEDGYVISKSVYTFIIRKQTDCQIQNIQAIIRNPITQLEIHHTTKDKKNLQDGIFTLYDEKQTPLYTFRDVPTGSIQMNGLTVGKTYHVMQNRELEGYQNIEYDFTVQNTSKVQQIYLYSIKNARKKMIPIQIDNVLGFLPIVINN